MPPSATLLLPCTARASDSPGAPPAWLHTLAEGELVIARAAASVPQSARKRIVAAIAAQDDAQFGCRDALRRALGLDAEILVTPPETGRAGPAQMAAQMIERAGIRGAIAIKDAESFFEATPLPEVSFVSVADLRAKAGTARLGQRSFAVVNENGLVVELVEGSPVSRFVSAGLFGFEDAVVFTEALAELAEEDEPCKATVSQVQSRAIANGHVVVPHVVGGLAGPGSR